MTSDPSRRKPASARERLTRSFFLMARYHHHTERTGFYVSAWVTDSKSMLFARGPKRFLFERRARRWASDERHSLEVDAWQRYMEATFVERQAA